MALIQVDNISFQYGRGTPFAIHALENVSFRLEKGELIAVIGQTGSGKSTLMQMLNALLTPDAGKIYLNGADIHESKKSKYQTRFHVGLCFQYPEYQLFGETCAEDIAFGPRNMGLEETEVQRRVREAASLVGMEPSLLQRSPFDLSGGERRRCAIAGVIAMEPELLILDEPTAGLDPEGRRAITSLIRSYRDRTGAAVLFVTHSMELAASLADRILVMRQGRLILDGTPSYVFSNEAQLKESGLTLPSFMRVLKEIRENGYMPADAYSLQEAADSIVSLLQAEGKL